MKNNDLCLAKVIEVKGKLGIKIPKKLTSQLNWNEGDKIVFETTKDRGFKLYKEDLI